MSRRSLLLCQLTLIGALALLPVSVWAAASSPAASAPEMTLQQVLTQIQTQKQDQLALEQEALTLLWRAAVVRSSPIRLALEKLSNPVAESTPTDKSSGAKARSVVKQAAQLGAVTSAMLTGSPLGLVTGQILSDALTVDGQTPARIGVSDVDLALLTKEVEQLQHQLLSRYLVYRKSRRLAYASRQSREAAFKDLQAGVARLSFQLGPSSSKDALEKHPLFQVMQAQYDQIAQLEQYYVRQWRQHAEALMLLTGPEAVEAMERQVGTQLFENASL